MNFIKLSIILLLRYLNFVFAEKCGEFPNNDSNEDFMVKNWPWHVNILQLRGNLLKFKCSGTLVGQTSVITSKYCIENENTGELSKLDEIKIAFGSFSFMDMNYDHLIQDVDRIDVDDDNEDFVLVSFLLSNSNVNIPVCIRKNTMNSNSFEGSIGYTGHYDLLQSAQVGIVDNNECNIGSDSSEALFCTKSAKGN